MKKQWFSHDDIVRMHRGRYLTHGEIMKMIPDSKKPGIHDAWEDSDGIWIMLKDGWIATRSCAERTIAEDYIKDLKWQIAGIKELPH